jgi:hypothetical protein
MPRFSIPDSSVVSRHRFSRPYIRLSLPLTMFVMLAICGWVIGPRIGVIELLALIFLLYVAVSALVTVAEITVIEEGLIIHRVVLPKRFVPWDAIDRTIVYTYQNGETGVHIEMATIALYEGLSPLNRLPGPVYGQGLRQTIVITPDALDDYETLLTALEQRCVVLRRETER